METALRSRCKNLGEFAHLDPAWSQAKALWSLDHRLLDAPRVLHHIADRLNHQVRPLKVNHVSTVFSFDQLPLRRQSGELDLLVMPRVRGIQTRVPEPGAAAS